MADVFGDQPINDDVTLDVLVGEGKKYNDPNQLAKAYVNIESFVEELKRDNAQLRAQKDANELNRQPEGNNEQPPATPQTPATPAETPNPTKDLRTLISEELQNLTQTQKFERNVEETAQKMIDVYGSPTKAQEAIASKARELGVSPEWLRDAAARSPQAFYATMGVDVNAPPPQSNNTPAPNSDIRSNPNPGKTGEKNWAYFQNLRKENKSLYYSTEVQAEMQRLARDKGDAFYT